MTARRSAAETPADHITGSSPDLRDALVALAALVDEHLAREADEPVRRPRDPERLRAEIDLTVGEARPFHEVVEELRAILAVTPSTASPRFFNQLFGGRDGAAMLGDLLATVLNSSMYTYKVGGVHVLIELELIRRMGGLMGFADADGVFAPGGSLSNLSAMMLARNRARPELAEGRPITGGALRVYTSADSHYSIHKAAAVLGIGRANVVDVAVDARGRMRPDALRAAIEADLAAGLTPCMINATAGTTVLGAFDPIPPLADLAERYGVWLHVDGAYGGSMVLHPTLRDRLHGAGRADSITWDAHKMMGVPLTCSVLLVRERGHLTRALAEDASYLFQDDTDDLNPGTRPLQCGRRNDVLKLWTGWRVHGDAGYRDRLVALRDLALGARDRIAADPDLTLVREPESLNVCFTVRGVSADRLCTALNRAGRAMVSHAIVDGAPVIRLVFLDPGVTTADVDAFFDAVRVTAAELRGA